MDSNTLQRPWHYALFQIPALLTAIFFVLAVLTSNLGWFPPNVSVQMMLDLSGSTYQNGNFKGAGTIMAAEIEAVKDYARQNSNSGKANLLSLSGFADQVIPITKKFSSNPTEIEQAIDQVVQPSIEQQIGGGTNLDLAVENGLKSLNTQKQQFKEMLVFTDGVIDLKPWLAARVKLSGVRLNFLVVDKPVSNSLAQVAGLTGGVALPADVNNIKELVSGQLRERFNSNSRIVNLFFGLAFISLMWMLVLPIDRLLQRLIHIRFDYSGIIALFNAGFWTIVTVFWVGLPFYQGYLNPWIGEMLFN